MRRVADGASAPSIGNHAKRLDAGKSTARRASLVVREEILRPWIEAACDFAHCGEACYAAPGSGSAAATRGGGPEVVRRMAPML